MIECVAIDRCSKTDYKAVALTGGMVVLLLVDLVC